MRDPYTEIAEFFDIHDTLLTSDHMFSIVKGHDWSLDIDLWTLKYNDIEIKTYKTKRDAVLATMACDAFYKITHKGKWSWHWAGMSRYEFDCSMCKAAVVMTFPNTPNKTMINKINDGELTHCPQCYEKNFDDNTKIWKEKDSG